MTAIAILVLGMHRSGTSAVTGMLEALGVDLGTRLAPGHEEINAKGYKEHMEIADLHDALLAAAGSTWDDVLELPDIWWHTGACRAVLHRLASAVERDFAAAPLWGVKDPRMCLTVPVWFEILERVGAEPRFLLPLRHPLQVAKSLARRDGMETRRGVHLWLRHVLAAESATRSHPRCIVFYDRVLSDPAGEAERIAAELDLRGRVAADSARRAAGFIEAGLRRQTGQDDEDQVLAAMDPLAARVYETFKSGAEDSALHAAIDDARNALSARCAGFDPMLVDYIGALKARERTWKLYHSHAMNSLSFRITRPLRRVKALFDGRQDRAAPRGRS